MKTTIAKINIQYPGKIKLPLNSPFYLNSGDREFKTIITSHFKPIEIKDFANSLIKDEFENVTIEQPISIELDDKWVVQSLNGFNSAYKNNSQELQMVTELYYTEIVMVYLVTDIEKLTSNQRTNKYLKQFIDSYKTATGDYHILPQRNNRKHAIFYEYNIRIPESLKNQNERQLLNSKLIYGTAKKPSTYISYGDIRLNFKEPEFDIDKNSEKLLKYLDSSEIEQFELTLISQAQENFEVDLNYKSALLNSFLAIETSLTNFINLKLSEANISNKEQKKYKMEMGIGLKLNILLKSIIKQLNEKEIKLLKDVDDLRKLRNSLVHDGVEITETEAKESIKISQEFVAFLELKNEV